MEKHEITEEEVGKVIASKKFSRHQKPTARQIKALHYVTQGYSKRAAMLKAGYSVSSAGHQANLLTVPSLIDVFSKVKYELLKDPDLHSGFIVKKFKEWMNATRETENGLIPDYKTQMGGYDRFKDLVKTVENSPTTKVRKRITFEQFVED